MDAERLTGRAAAPGEASLLALLAVPEAERLAFWKKNGAAKLAKAAAADGLAGLAMPSRLRAALLASLPAGAGAPASPTPSSPGTPDPARVTASHTSAATTAATPTQAAARTTGREDECTSFMLSVASAG